MEGQKPTGDGPASLLELLRRASAQEAPAWEQLLAVVRPVLCRRLSAQGVPPADASDVAQETLLALWNHLAHFRGETEGELWAWLDQICRRKFLDAARREARRPRQPLPDEANRLAALPGDDSRPSEQAARHEEDQRREAALARLSADDQLVLRLRFHEGREWPEVAAVMGRSLAAVMKLYHRALGRWKSLVGPDAC
jgi:RNA polymerase sigma-70 factor (ECF subfamily)